MRNHKECCLYFEISYLDSVRRHITYTGFTRNVMVWNVWFSGKQNRSDTSAFGFHMWRNRFFLLFLHNLMVSIISCVRVDWRDSQMDHKYYLVTWCQVHWLNHIHIDVCACLMLVCLCLCIFVCCFFSREFFAVVYEYLCSVVGSMWDVIIPKTG